MKKNVLIMLILSMTIILSGCSEKTIGVTELDSSEEKADIEEVAEVIGIVEDNEEKIVEDNEEETKEPTGEELLELENQNRIALYESFMTNDALIHIDGKDSVFQLEADVNENLWGYDSLSYDELVDFTKIDASRFDEGAVSELDEIEYAYVDTADHKGKVMLLRVTGMNIYEPDDSSERYYVIAPRDGKLYMTGIIETWARSGSEILDNGYILSGGSGGAGDYLASEIVILSDGSFEKIYHLESLCGEHISMYFDSALYNELLTEDGIDSWKLTLTYYEIGGKEYFTYEYDENATEVDKTAFKEYISRCNYFKTYTLEGEKSINIEEWYSMSDDNIIDKAIEEKVLDMGIERNIDGKEIEFTQLM